MSLSATPAILTQCIQWLRRHSARQPQGPWWRDVVNTTRDPRKRVLWLVGNLAQAKQMFPLDEAQSADTTILTAAATTASGLDKLVKGNVSVVFAEFETAPLAGDYDLCLICPTPEQIPDLYEEWLEGSVARALKPGGKAILPLPRDRRTGMLPHLPTSEAAVPLLQEFLNFHFTDSKKVVDFFNVSSNFSFEGILEKGFEPSAFAWLRLSKRATPPAKATSAFARSPRVNRFPMNDFAIFSRRLRKANIQVVRTAEFAKRFEAFAAGNDDGQGFGIVKFDIHRGIRRAEEMARILANASRPGLFLMMHRHETNTAFYDHPETWNILRSIERMGHEVGLHMDPFDLVRRHGDLLIGAASAANELRTQGLSVTTATLHGDTRTSIRARGLRSLDFFEEGKHVTTWDGVVPDDEPALSDHLGRYTLSELQTKAGISFLAETTFGNAGNMIQPFVPLYISDNTRFIRTSGGRKQRLRGEEPFRISFVTARRISTAMQQKPFIALFHPQWYW